MLQNVSVQFVRIYLGPIRHIAHTNPCLGRNPADFRITFLLTMNQTKLCVVHNQKETVSTIAFHPKESRVLLQVASPQLNDVGSTEKRRLYIIEVHFIKDF